VIFYDTEPLAIELVIPGNEGGSWGNGGVIEADCNGRGKGEYTKVTPPIKYILVFIVLKVSLHQIMPYRYYCGDITLQLQ